MKILEWNRNNQRKYVERRLKEIESVKLDFVGQTVFEKVDEGVVYFNNPLLDEAEEDISNMKALNVKLESLKNENVSLMDAKRRIVGNNKTKVEEIRSLMDKIDHLN